MVKIADIIQTKKLQVEFTKVKSHSEDKWNDRADKLAKEGLRSKRRIFTEEISCSEIEYRLE